MKKKNNNKNLENIISKLLKSENINVKKSDITRYVKSSAMELEKRECKKLPKVS